MRRKLSVILLSSCALLSAASWDGCCPVECKPRGWFSGDWEGAISALYWKPDNGGFQFGTVQTVGPPANTNLRDVKPNYHWGIRGYSRFARTGGCSYIELAGLWVRGNDAGSVGPGFVRSPFGISTNGEVFGKLRHEYWNIDFRVGQILFTGCKFCWKAFGGVRYANFDFRQRIRFTAPATDTRWDQDVRFYGIGPEIGVEGVFPIWRCFDFIGGGTFVALVGERCTKIDNLVVGASTVRFRFARATAIAPGFDLVVAGRYRMNCGCVSISGELGYEMNHVWNAYNLQNAWSPFSSSAPYVRRTERDIGWAGPYLRVGIGF